MILFVTGQFAGAQYIHPLIKRWQNNRNKTHPLYKIVATGISAKYWEQQKIKYDSIEKDIDSVNKYLSIHKPNSIILSASGSEELEFLFILQAKQAGIKTVSFIDIWTNYKNRFIYKGNKVFPDTILSIDDKCTEEMIDDGIPANLIKEVGQPYLEDICNTIPPLGKKIVIPIQPIKKTRGDALGYDEHDFLKVILEALNNTDIENQIYITSHPDSNFANIQKSRVNIGAGRGLIDIKDAHTLLGMFSMQMIVAYIWGRKVASIQPGLLVEDPCPLSRWGLVPVIQDSEHLKNFMKEPVDNNSAQILMKKIVGSQDRFNNYLLQGIA